MSLQETFKEKSFHLFTIKENIHTSPNLSYISMLQRTNTDSRHWEKVPSEVGGAQVTRLALHQQQ